jgi:hypothetical protein
MLSDVTLRDTTDAIQWQSKDGRIAICSCTGVGSSGSGVRGGMPGVDRTKWRCGGRYFPF